MPIGFLDCLVIYFQLIKISVLFFRMEQVVWVPDPKEGFVLATIVDLGMDEVTVQPVGTSKANFTLPLDRMYTADPHFDNKDVDDNCKHNNILYYKSKTDIVT